MGDQTAVVKMNEPRAVVAQDSTDPMALIRLAVEGGAGIDQLERLVQLKRDVDTYAAQRAYTEAMTKAKAELPIVLPKTKAVKAGSAQYKHAELGDICRAAVPILAKHGISHTWHTEQPDLKSVKVTCTLTHAAGHSESVSLWSPVDTTGNKNAIQAVGSAVTYLQRYTFKSALGIAEGGQDDDGQAAGRRKDEPQQQTGEVQGATSTRHDAPTAEQLNRLVSLHGDPRATDDQREYIAKVMRNPELTKSWAGKIIGKLKATIAEKTGKPYEPWEAVRQAEAQTHGDAHEQTDRVDDDAPADDSQWDDPADQTPDWMDPEADDSVREPGEDIE